MTVQGVAQLGPLEGNRGGGGGDRKNTCFIYVFKTHGQTLTKCGSQIIVSSRECKVVQVVYMAPLGAQEEGPYCCDSSQTIKLKMPGLTTFTVFKPGWV